MTGVFKNSFIFDTIWIVYLCTLFVVMCVEIEGIICYTGGKNSDWLFDTNWVIFQLCYDENTIPFCWDDICFVLDQHAELEFYSASSLK